MRILNKKDKEYLASHPLAFEILYLLSELGEATTGVIARKLRRGLSTVYHSLNDVVEKTDLLISSKVPFDQRNTSYSVVDNDDLKMTINDDAVISAFAVSSSRLRKVPITLMKIFQNKLSRKLTGYNVEQEVKIHSILNALEVTFLLTKGASEVYLDVTRIRKKEEERIHENIGKLIELMVDQDISKKLIVVYLFSVDYSRSYEEYIIQLIKKVNNYNLDVEAIVDFVNDEDLVNQYFIEKISEKILARLNV